MNALVALFCVGVYGFAAPATRAPDAGKAAPMAADPLHRESPRSSVYSFLEACRAGNYAQAWRYLDLRSTPREQRSKIGPRLAQQLELILDHDGLFDVASLSENTEGVRGPGDAPPRERVDSYQLDGTSVDLDMTRVTLRSGLSVWLFSAESVPLTPRLARALSDSAIEKYLPGPMVEWKFLGTPVWRWVALALLAAILVPLYRFVSRPVVWLAQRIGRRISPGLDWGGLNGLSGPLRLLLCIALFRAGMEWVEPSSQLREQLDRLLSFLLFAALAWFSMGVVDLIMRRLRSMLASRHRTFSHSAMPLVSRVLKIAIFLLTIAAILNSWGYNTTTILAGLGVGGLAIALAAQKTIENLFGGVAVITDQPVAVGDFCRFGELVGTVEDVGLRSTRIRTLQRTLVTVPNSEFSTMTLENYSKRDKMWFHITLNLRRDTLPDQVRGLLGAITQMLQDHARVETGPLPVRFIGVGTYSLDLEVFAYVLTREYDEFLQVQQELVLWILDAIQSAGTALAVPTQAYLSLSSAAPAPDRAPAV